MYLRDLVTETIKKHQAGQADYTLLAVCPNSSAVLEAAIQAGAECNAPVLFAATLNQVDREESYTGWTPGFFVEQMRKTAERNRWKGPLYPCLDHGGPWLKDLHRIRQLSYAETMQAVKDSLTACLEAGYELLHIDPTVDRSIPPDQALDVETVVERTLELIEHSEAERARLKLPPIVYEVGTEEVHGGLVDLSRLELYLDLLQKGLSERSLTSAWPGFVVAQLGTDLHTSYFNPDVASRIHDLVTPLGLLIKGHYTDWVKNPGDYPKTGIGAANIGPEFTAVECMALSELDELEKKQIKSKQNRSDFYNTLVRAVVKSGRWKKWLQPEEEERPFNTLKPDRQAWLVQTGARYIWIDPDVQAARNILYENLGHVIEHPHGFVVDRIAGRIKKYLQAFNLVDFLNKCS